MKSIIAAYKQVIANQIAKDQPKHPVLVETTLEPHHQDLINDYYDDEISEGTQEKITKALGHNNFVHFQLPSTESQPDADVAEHLATHGYDIDDYTKGIAAKKIVVGDPSRGIPHREKVVKQSISAVLDKTGAEDHIKKSFINDPARSSSKKSDANPLHVVITKTAYGVGGMSTGTHWTSCMNLDTGVNKHYIENDIKAGTHVAYLTHHDDETAFKHGEPSKPVARIALKPFHASVDTDDEDGPAFHEGSDTIFRPELATYGNSTPAFIHAVSQWAVKNYPAKAGVTYHKNSSVYDDSGNLRYKTDTVPNLIAKLDRGESPVLDEGDMLDHHMIDSLVKHVTDTPTIKNTYNLLKIGNLGTKHILDLHRASSKLNDADKRSVLWNLALQHGDKFSIKMHNEFIASKFDTFPNKLLRSPKLPEEIIDALPTSKLSQVQRSKVKDHHVDRVVDALVQGKRGSYYDANDMAWAMKSQHIDKLVTSGKGTEPFVADHPEMTKDTFKKSLMLAKNSNDVKRILVNSKHARFSDFENNIGENHADVFHTYASNPHLTDDDKKKLAGHFMKAVAKYQRPSLTGAMSNANRIVSTVPKSIGDHIDYEKLANMDTTMVPRFANPEHSWKHIDALFEHAKKTDHEYDKHRNGDNDSFDEDDHWRALGRYTDALDQHFDDHIAGDGYGEIKNHIHFDRFLNRLDDHYSAFNHDGDSFYGLKNKISEYE